MKFYLAGQTSFGNRGCEALVRGTIDILRERLGPTCSFLVPSLDPAADGAQWGDASAYGVSFVPAPAFPPVVRYWCSLMARLPGMAGAEPPVPRLDEATEAALAGSDAVLMIGGDIVSLDYGIHSLYFWSKLIDRARKLGKPTYLWAASVGPFEADRRVASAMAKHLKGYAGISVRETESQQYLGSQYRLSPLLVGDPAFRLAVTPPREQLGVDVQRVQGSVVLNISPLVNRIAVAADRTLADEVRDFVDWLTVDQGRRVTLLYHVDQAEKPLNSDLGLLTAFAARLKNPAACYVLPAGLNACELKWVISRGAMLIAARTHATIAAFSTGVPCISIKYSRKAAGLNNDIFGDERYVVDSKGLTVDTLKQVYRRVVSDEDDVRQLLLRQAARLRAEALKSADIVR